MGFTMIGELLNTSRPGIQKAVEQRDEETICPLVLLQEKQGAAYIDINAGAGVHTERRDMQWLVRTVQAVTNLPLCLDSPDPHVLASAWEILDRPPMINSISLEKNRFQSMLDLLKGRECQVVALCMDDTGMPETAEQICGRAHALVNGLAGIHIQPNAIWIDPLVGPVSTHTGNGLISLKAVALIKKQIPGINTVCGLSNISFGLPNRRIINRMFLGLMMGQGLDGAIMDPGDRDLTAALKTVQMLMNQDEYCMGFMEYFAANSLQADHQ
ncbi:MAG: dihydropteroate synthase [Desulfobacter sp.]|nr:dihydropteroate synthase [Desulfobacter sp.]WDP84780.1 MAG: dihydropteroate synthase [Desulfobacter sp.]